MEMYFSLSCSPTLAVGKDGGDCSNQMFGTPTNRDSTLDTWLLRSSLVPVGEERENGDLPGRYFRGRPGCDIYHSAHMPLARTQWYCYRKLQRRLGNVV